MHTSRAYARLLFRGDQNRLDTWCQYYSLLRITEKKKTRTIIQKIKYFKTVTSTMKENIGMLEVTFKKDLI